MLFPLKTKTIRVNDDFGSGLFNASRGNHKHKGVDYLATLGENIYSPIDGLITKHGYAYTGDTKHRYVEISNEKNRIRIFYVGLKVPVLSRVKKGQIIAVFTGISEKFNTETKTMLQHIHLEIYENEILINPETKFIKNDVTKVVGFVLVPTVFLLVWYIFKNIRGL